METLHSEGGESPFVVKDDATITAVMALYDEDAHYPGSPVENCGEAILLTELDSHIEMHGAEGEDTDQEFEPTYKEAKIGEGIKDTFDTNLAYALRNLDQGEQSSSTSPLSHRQASDPQAGTKAAWKKILKMPDTSFKAKGKL